MTAFFRPGIDSLKHPVIEGKCSFAGVNGYEAPWSLRESPPTKVVAVNHEDIGLRERESRRAGRLEDPG